LTNPKKRYGEVVELQASDYLREIKFVIKGLRGLRWRVWVATKLFLLAGWVMGCQIEIER